jgi:SAM-dependent methyltransferase
VKSERPGGAGAIYARPLLYDIAFGYRDIPREIDCVLGWYQQASGRDAPPRRILELACGPAEHALELARRGAQAAGLDASEEMVAYAGQKAALLGLPLALHLADMVDFSLAERFDLALLMMNSAAHLHDLDRLVEHLQTVAAHLEPHGVYLLEIQHPRDFVGRGARSGAPHAQWTMARWGLEVQTRWGSPDDPYDPLQQLFGARVEMRVRGPDGEQRLVETVPMRDWTWTELQAAVRLSGRFEIAGAYGDFAPDVTLDDEGAWRMILALRRRP